MNHGNRLCGLFINDPDIYEIRLMHLENAKKRLEMSRVPVSDDPCRTCTEPCELGHPDYPARFDMDLTSELLGEVKPYRRQVVISTGKTDWEKDITEAEGSLAQYLSRTSEEHRGPSVNAGSPLDHKPKQSDGINVPGVFNSSEETRLSILNGSYDTISCDDRESVLVFPDYKLVKDVERSQEGAELLWRMALDPSLNRAGRPYGDGAKSWLLPYASVILLCSHKRRDNRCHIAAPKLQTVFTQSLEIEGFEVHTQLEDPSGPSLEEFKGTEEDREIEFLRRLQGVVNSEEPRKVLILKNSHVGGHKYSGNVVIYTPQGSGVWYGRVSPHEVPAVVKTTICEGKVLPALLRGGTNLTRPQGKGLLTW